MIRRDSVGDYMVIDDAHGIYLLAPANYTQLVNQPTDTSVSSLAIATVGYCQSKFGKVKTVNNTSPDENGNVTIAVGTGTVKSVDHHSPDSNGNVQLNAICTINGHNGDSVGNFAGVVMSVNGNTPTDGAVTMTVVESVDGVSPVNGNVELNAVKSVDGVSPDANGDVDLGAVTSVDGHTPDANGEVSFGLTADKWLKSDASGHITTTNDSVISVPSGTTPQSQTVNMVTDVVWTGTVLQKKYRQLVFTNGVLTSVGSENTITVDTPTVVTWR